MNNRLLHLKDNGRALRESLILTYAKTGEALGAKTILSMPKRYQWLFYKVFNREKTSLREKVKAKCLDCSVFQKDEIARCPVKACPLYEVRPYQ